MSESPDKNLPFFDIVFDGPPGHESGRFVEVEDSQGRSFKAGDWIERGDGLWALRLWTSLPSATAPTIESIIYIIEGQAKDYPTLAAREFAPSVVESIRALARSHVEEPTAGCTCYTHPITGDPSTRERREQCPVHRALSPNVEPTCNMGGGCAHRIKCNGQGHCEYPAKPPSGAMKFEDKMALDEAGVAPRPSTAAITDSLGNPLVERMREIDPLREPGGARRVLKDAADVIERLEKERADQSMSVLVPIEEYERLKALPSSTAAKCGKCGMGPLRESCAYPEACEHPCRELALKLNQALLAVSATRPTDADTFVDAVSAMQFPKGWEHVSEEAERIRKLRPTDGRGADWKDHPESGK